MVRVATHNGTFHYDEVLATALLQIIYGDDTEVVRTRDRAVMDAADIVYDVGGVFAPESKRFDHHQRTFTETYSEKYDTKLSSCGLVYKYFCDALFAKYGFEKAHVLYEDIKERIYSEFFLYADAIDNGSADFGAIKPRTMSSFVAGFNVWECENEALLEKMQYDRFTEALSHVRKDLENYLSYIFNDYVANYMRVYEELVPHSGEIYVTKLKASPALVFDVDEKLAKGIKYVIYKNRDDYRVLALPVRRGSFETRAPLKQEWRGLKDDELSESAGIPGCVFVHATGFTGGNKTLDGAIQMCKASLECLRQV